MGAAMGITMGAQGASGFANAYSQSKAIEAQSEYQASVLQTNSELANVKSQVAEQEGDIEAGRNDAQVSRVVGADRASAGAQGINANAGSAEAVQASTAGLGELDSLAIKNNAWQQAWGYQVQGINDKYSAEFTQIAGAERANNTLLTGGMNFASSAARAGYDFKSGGSYGGGYNGGGYNPGGMYVPGGNAGYYGAYGNYNYYGQ